MGNFLAMRRIFFLFILFYSIISFGQKNSKTIGFIENKGQIIDQKGKENKAVLYLLNTPGLNIQLKKNAFSYDVYETKNIPLTKADKALYGNSNGIDKIDKIQKYSTEYKYHRIDIDFLNSNTNVQLVAEEKSSDYDNYYNVTHAPEGITNVHKYQKVTYQNIYNNIDVVFFIPKDTTKVVEYNFIVKPGGKVSDIQLKFNGAKTELADNKIKMKVRFGQMEETLPLSWIEQENSRKEIAVGYKKIKKNVYGFEGDVNPSDKTIVIDPVPVRLWGTFYGGSGNEQPNCIVNDSGNNIYVSGTTTSLSNIATAGTHLSSISNSAGFIAKMDTNGQRIWGTYYFANLLSINVDNSFNVYATGNAINALSIATPGSHQPIKDAYNDAYLIKLNSVGIREWATYYGGNNNDYGRSICFDNDNNVYLGGGTNSQNAISTAGSHQEINNSTGDYEEAFLVKFTPQGLRLWGTYYGGTLADGFVVLHFSNDNYLYATGISHSSNNISTLNSYQPTLNGGADAMIIKFNLNGQRIWGSYLGGESEDYIFAHTLKDDNLYLSGRTQSHTNISTPGTFSQIFTPLQNNNNESNCIIKFNVATQQKEWGTYFLEHINSLKVNQNGDSYITGSTTLNTGIATPNAYQTVRGGYLKVYLNMFNNLGQRIWGTYYGGNLAEQLSMLTVDHLNNIYLYGLTTSSTGIATIGAHQGYLGSNPDTFLAKFLDCQSSALATSNSPICIGENLNLTASGGTNYNWIGPNGFTSTQQNPVITNVNASHSGLYSCTILGGGCNDTVSVNVLVGDTTAPIPTITALSTINGDCNTSITSIPTATDNCAGNINATTTSSLSFSVPGTYTVVWNYNDGNGNISSQNQTVIISATALPTLNTAQQFCIQQNATLNTITITGQNIKWYDAPTGGNLLANTTLLQNGTTYYASQTINNCESTRVPVTVTIQNTPAPTGNTNQSFCSSQNATLNDITISGTSILWYNSATGTTVLPSTTLLSNNTTYFATQTANNCESPTRLPVTVTLINTLNANDYTETLCDDLNDGSEIINLSDYNTQLISSTTNHTFSYYTSRNSAENQINADEITNYNNYNLTTGTLLIYVRIDSSNGCHQVVELKLTLVNKPVIPITDIMPICEGSSITVNAGTGFDSYLWSTTETTSSITISNPGSYSVKVSQNYGTLVCTSIKNFTVVNSNKATVSEIITSDWTYNQNTITVLLTGNSVGDYVYSLDGIHFQTSNTFAGLESGEYTVFIKDKNGCGVQPTDFYLLMYPKFFTPNGDGYNDTWKIKFSENEPELTVKIFDRYGKLIKQLGSNSEGWNGTYNNQLLPATDYWFTVTRQNGKEYKGHFTLKR